MYRWIIWVSTREIRMDKDGTVTRLSDAKAKLSRDNPLGMT